MYVFTVFEAVVPVSLIIYRKAFFDANHPFVYYLRVGNNILFNGHYKN
jgi:hypothetical protein